MSFHDVFKLKKPKPDHSNPELNTLGVVHSSNFHYRVSQKLKVLQLMALLLIKDCKKFILVAGPTTTLK
jgi:hypothetical protein